MSRRLESKAVAIGSVRVMGKRKVIKQDRARVGARVMDGYPSAHTLSIVCLLYTPKSL